VLTRVLVLLMTGLLAGVVEVPAATAGATEVAMTADDVTSRWDESAVFAAVGLPEDATGTVAFALDGGEACVAEVSAGEASCTTGLRPEVATYAVTATYSGDEVHAGTSERLDWTVSRAWRVLRLQAPDRVVRRHRALLHVRLRAAEPCPYAACRTSGEEGVVVWTVVRSNGGARFRHRTVVDDGRARWRAPRLPRRGRYVVHVVYLGAPHFTDTDGRNEFVVS
jgi:hypothetical protein